MPRDFVMRKRAKAQIRKVVSLLVRGDWETHENIEIAFNTNRFIGQGVKETEDRKEETASDQKPKVYAIVAYAQRQRTLHLPGVLFRTSIVRARAAKYHPTVTQ